MHIADLSLGILGANGIVAAGAPIAAGAAWASKQEGSDRVVACFFGDGGVNQGVLHETMNLATLWSLPLVFVCENNGYAVTLSTAHSTAGSIVERARAYGMPAEQVDGMDVLAVLEASERAVARARRGEGLLPLHRAPHSRTDDGAQLPQRGGDRHLARARPTRALRAIARR
jgi:pyruvate dehydrogenase E1 component alpha subunit